MKNKFVKISVLLTIFMVGIVFLFKPVIKKIKYGIDLQGGFEVIYKIEPLKEGDNLTEKDYNATYEAIVRRIDTLGVSEPVITFEGENLLRISLPGVKDEEEARKRISTMAILSFRDTDDKLLMTSNVLGSGKASYEYDTTELASVVKLDIKDTETFYNVTKKVSQKEENIITIWLDFDAKTDSYKEEKELCGTSESNCISAASVNEGLMDSNIVIKGNFTKEEANELVELINSGALPTKLVEESSPHIVSASFGEKTIYKAGIALLITILLVTIIMSIKYRFSGFISSLCLIVYSLLVFIIFNEIGGVLTLTGLAALVLGIGVAIDSSVITIERIKDEYKNNKNIPEACKKGNKESLLAIVDANITTLIVAIILYIFGESSIKGFATMLIISIIITILCMICLNRYLLKKYANTNYFKNKEKCFFGKENREIKFNFINKCKYIIIAFVIIIMIASINIFKDKINYGIDFSGGTNISMISETKLNINEYVKYLKKYDVQDFGHYVATDKEGYIKLNEIVDENGKDEIKEYFEQENVEISINEISTRVTENLTKNAIYSLIIASISIVIYIAIRFNFNYSISAIAALIHDVLIMIAVVLIFRIQVNFILVAALLTIIGYSINDTIVIFDRIRETLKNSKNKTIDYDNIVNESLNKTLSRNIITTLTTLIAVLLLIILGINEIITFNISTLAGLIAGCISSLFLAPYIWCKLEEKSSKKPKKEIKEEIEEKSIRGINS